MEKPQHEPNMYSNTFTWTPVFKTGYHHQIGMDYLYDAIFKMATSEVKLRVRL